MLDVFWQVVNVTTWIHHWNPLCYICTPPVSKTRTHQIWPSQLFSLSTVIGPFLWQLSHSKQHGYIIGIPFLRFKLKHPRKNTFKNAHFDQVLLLRTRSDLETTIRWQLCSPLLHRDWSNLLNLANAYVPEDRISYVNFFHSPPSLDRFFDLSPIQNNMDTSLESPFFGLSLSIQEKILLKTHISTKSYSYELALILKPRSGGNSVHPCFTGIEVTS